MAVPGSRKRRTSDSRADSGYSSSLGSWRAEQAADLSQCTAAIALMNLSVSPRERASVSLSCPPATPRPSPAHSLSGLQLGGEEEEEAGRGKRSRLAGPLLLCTWPGCQARDTLQEGMERHVRGHLGLPEPAPGTNYEGEEDFYYREAEWDEEETSEVGEMGTESGGSGHASPPRDIQSGPRQLVSSRNVSFTVSEIMTSLGENPASPGRPGPSSQSAWRPHRDGAPDKRGPAARHPVGQLRPGPRPRPPPCLGLHRAPPRPRPPRHQPPSLPTWTKDGQKMQKGE